MFLKCRTLMAIAFVVLSAAIAALLSGLVDPEYSTLGSDLPSHHNGRLLCASRNPQQLGECYPKNAPAKGYDAATDRYNVGRFRSPVVDTEPQVLSEGQHWLQWKQFFWSSVSDGDWMIGVAMLNFGYNAGVVVNVFNRVSLSSYSRQIELPLILAPLFGPQWYPDGENRTSIRYGCVEMAPLFDNSFVQSCTNAKGTVRNVTISLWVYDNIETSRDRIFFNVAFEFPLISADSMNLVFPLGPRRASMVSKGGGINSRRPAAGATHSPVSFTLDSYAHEMVTPVVNYDYTRGLLRRLTIWKWLSLGAPASRFAVEGLPVHRSYGLQLSTGTYDVDGISVESTVWIDGRLYPLEVPIRFQKVDAEVPPYQSKWRVFTDDGKLNLEFTPHGRFHGDFHYIVIDGDLHHMWTGTAPVYTPHM